ncbi:DNA replication factor Cdt1 C-terminal domain [Phytophthora infestans]|uniref:DNA replication factor Cdt1 C-terminal domain n=1 Tax=Phytophthora infestans TaxID=4787 RepID=A0A8S9U1W5_PHYIN|nr:DNA replication factor Cdt1 C-terminal domain [Phytophthora infestans]
MEVRRSTRRLDKRAPPSLRILARLFSALEFGLGALTLYQHTRDFAAVKRAVESSCQLSFTPTHLQQILYLLPGAYTLEWKKNTRTARRQAQEEGGDYLQAQRQRLQQQPPVLTLRNKQLPPPNETCESLEARITLFFSKVNAYVDGHVQVIKNEFPDITDDELKDALKLVEIEKAPLPKIPSDIVTEDRPAALLERKENKDQTDGMTDTKVKEKLEQALAKPVPEDLKSLPEWLINKVRQQEVSRKDVAENSAKALKKRMLATLPQLSDQLQSLVIVTKKSIFPKAEVVRRLAVRAPIKGKIEEQLYLLESLVPEWLTVVLDSGKEYIKISTSCKYNTVKASLRRAISVEA